MSTIYFNLWLEEQQEGLWEIYKQYVENKYPIDILIETYPSYYIGGYFDWGRTTEGVSFWGNLSKKWRKFIKDKNIQNIKVIDAVPFKLKRRVN